MIETAEMYRERMRAKGSTWLDMRIPALGSAKPIRLGLANSVIFGTVGLLGFKEAVRLKEEQARIRSIAVHKGASVGFSTGLLYSSVPDEYWREFKQASRDLGKSFLDLNFNRLSKQPSKQHWQKGFKEESKIPQSVACSGSLSDNTKSKLRKKRKKRRR